MIFTLENRPPQLFVHGLFEVQRLTDDGWVTVATYNWVSAWKCAEALAARHQIQVVSVRSGLVGEA